MLPPPMTSGMIVTSGATPARPSPLPARAPTVPETDAPWLPLAPLSMSALFEYQFQPWQSPRLPTTRWRRSAGPVGIGPERAGQVGMGRGVAGVDDGDDHSRAGGGVPAVGRVDVGVRDDGALTGCVRAGVVEVPAVAREEGVGDRAGHRDGGGDLDARDAGDRGQVLGHEPVGGDQGAAVEQRLGADHAVDVLEAGQQLRGRGTGGGGEDVAGQAVARAPVGDDRHGRGGQGGERRGTGIAGDGSRGQDHRLDPLAVHRSSSGRLPAGRSGGARPRALGRTCVFPVDNGLLGRRVESRRAGLARRGETGGP